MAAYATVQDVQDRMSRTMTESEQAGCATLLDDAAVVIDAYNAKAGGDAKKVVSCRMVIRALGDGAPSGFPLGAQQGSMTALGYTQQWTLPSGSGAGELYIGKTERQLLGCGNQIGSRSPTEDLVPPAPPEVWT